MTTHATDAASAGHAPPAGLTPAEHRELVSETAAAKAPAQRRSRNTNAENGRGAKAGTARAAKAEAVAANASAPARLARLLNLVPYLLARPGIEIAEAATDL